jgi:hypothetical protein
MYFVQRTLIVFHQTSYKLFIVLFDTTHHEDVRRRRPKRVGVVSEQLEVHLLIFLYKTCINARCVTHKIYGKIECVNCVV